MECDLICKRTGTQFVDFSQDSVCGFQPRGKSLMADHSQLILCFPSDLQEEFISPCGACRQVMREVSHKRFLLGKYPSGPLGATPDCQCGQLLSELYTLLAESQDLPEFM